MISTNLESAHAHHWTEREQFPDEPQPVRVTAWQDDPGNGAIVSRFGRCWMVLWRDTDGKQAAQGHDSYNAALNNAQRVTQWRHGVHAKPWNAETERINAERQDIKPTGRRAA